MRLFARMERTAGFCHDPLLSLAVVSPQPAPRSQARSGDRFGIGSGVEAPCVPVTTAAAAMLHRGLPAPLQRRRLKTTL
jgi:hypothetical protein